MGLNNAINKNPVVRWSGRAFWATADQGIFAGSNFLLNILLARWLSNEQYGAFTISYSSFLILGVFHTSLITEPMLIFGAGRYSASFISYYHHLRRLHWKLVASFCLLASITAQTASLLGNGLLANAFWGMCLAIPVILLLWLVRRTFYVVLSPLYPAQGGMAYGVLSLSIIYLIYRWGHLSPFSTYCAIFMSCLTVSLVLSAKLYSRSKEEKDAGITRIDSEHWQYARWILPSALITWIPSNAAYLLLAATGDLEGGASYRALMNLQMPVLHINTALSLLILPSLSKLLQSGNYLQFHKNVRSYIIIYAGFSALFMLLLLIAHTRIMAWLYVGKFSDYASLVPVLSIFLIFASFSAVFGTAMRCLQATRKIFHSVAVGAFVSLGTGIWFIPTMGVRGAVWSMVLASAFEAGMMALMYKTAKPRVY